MADDKTIIRKQIENFIYIIRAHKVMLDEDLAKLYQVETKVLVQVSRLSWKRTFEKFCNLQFA